MKNQKGFIVPLLIAIAVLVIGGGVYYFSQNKNVTRTASNVSQSDQTAVANCKSMIATDWNKGFQCILDLGKSISNIRACDSLSDTSQSKDPDVQKQDFVSLCKIDYATSKKDVSICSSLTSFSNQMTQVAKNTCIIGVVRSTKDPSTCTGIPTTNERSMCIASTKSGADQCSTLADQNTQGMMCYSNLAVNEKDSSICSKITGKDAPSNQEFCIARIAQTMNTWQLCNTIKTTTTRDFCVAQVIELNKLDRKLCDNAGSRKDMCYAYPK